MSVWFVCFLLSTSIFQNQVVIFAGRLLPFCILGTILGPWQLYTFWENHIGDIIGLHQSQVS